VNYHRREVLVNRARRRSCEVLIQRLVYQHLFTKVRVDDIHTIQLLLNKYG
jgi:hypothetical protein